MIQFKPCRAKKKYEEPTNADPSHYYEQKIDGERFKIHTTDAAPHRCDSRRESVVNGLFVEKSDRVPHIMEVPLPHDSIFDNEFVSKKDEILIELPGKFWDKLMNPEHPHTKWFLSHFGGALPIYPHVRATASIMGCLGPEAVRRQREEDAWIRSYCFDIVRYQGKDPRRNSQLARRNFLAQILESVTPNPIILMPAWWGLTKAEIEELFYLITDEEGEGLIGKDPAKPYDHAQNWWKMKRFYPVDVVTTGDYKVGDPNRPLVAGKVASIGIGVYHHGALYHIGWVSSIIGSHQMIDTITDMARNDTLAGRVLEVNHNGLQSDPTHPLGNTLRHPRASTRRPGFRTDKSPKDCTWGALLEEIKKGNK